MALRVVAGSAGGLYLKVPRNAPVRPTQDRIKQAIFSSLGAAVLGAQVVDLYAGTGALGIEALSRGASSATFVERDPECSQAIRHNLQHCRLTGSIVRCPVERFLAQPPATPLYDIVLADPPYSKQDLDRPWTLSLPTLLPFLRPRAIVMWEYLSGQSGEVPPSLQEIWTRQYGETTVTHLQLI